jgi:hypothetical protein
MRLFSAFATVALWMALLAIKQGVRDHWSGNVFDALRKTFRDRLLWIGVGLVLLAWWVLMAVNN